MKKINIITLLIIILTYSCGTRVDTPLKELNNKTPGITVNQPPTTLLSESGTTTSLSVELDSSPSGIVTISVSIDNPNEGTIISPFSGSSGTLTFDPTNWFIPQVITVKGIDDLIADGNQPFTLIFGTSNSTDARYNGTFKPVDIVFTNVDNEIAGVTVKAAPSALIVTETGMSNSFDVVLNTKPSGNVFLPVSVSNPGEGTITAPFTGSTGTLTFSATNWNVPQTVTVKGVADAAADGNTPFTVAFGTTSSSDTVYNGTFTPAPVNFINIDNNKAGVTVNAGTTLLVSESGTVQSFQIVLNSQPTANVTMNVTTGNPAEGKVQDPVFLLWVNSYVMTFTPLNWNTPQTVTVQGQPDNIVDGNQPFTVNIGTTASLDPVYNGTFAPAPVNFINTDIDKAGVIVATPTTFLVDENGFKTSTFSIVLNSKPTGNVTMTLFSSDITIGTVTGPIIGNIITFMSSNWNTPQIFTVTGAFSGLGTNQPFTVVIGNTISADLVYNNKFNPPDLNFITVDNTAPGITLSRGDFLLTNGNIPTQDFFEIVLNSSPAISLFANLNITISDPLAAAFVSPSVGNPILISFDSTNWNIPQKIFVKGVARGIPGLYPYTITIDPAAPVASTDGAYLVLPPVNIFGYNTE